MACALRPHGKSPASCAWAWEGLRPAGGGVARVRVDDHYGLVIISRAVGADSPDEADVAQTREPTARALQAPTPSARVRILALLVCQGSRAFEGAERGTARAARRIGTAAE